MNVSAHRAFALLRELGYERVSGSPQERAVAERLMEEARGTGAQAALEEFSVPCGRVHKAVLKVTAPYEKVYEATGYQRARSTLPQGLDGEFYYAEDLLPAHLQRVPGKIVLMNGRLRRKDYEALQKAGAAAILTFSGATLDRRGETDCDIRKLRETLTDPFGDAVALNMRAADAAEMVRRGAKTVHLELAGESYDGVSQNVCAVVPGTDFPEEIVSFGAHYDSVYFSSGVYDNLSGSVILLELLRYFAAHPPRRTLKFNWFGSEEQGLLGSKAWTEAHAAELEKHRLMINLDVAGATLGHNSAPVLGTPAVTAYVDGLMRELGIACAVKSDIYSSDCIPFADHGVPAVNLCRFGAPGANYIHDRRDSLKSGYLDEHALDITLQQALFLARRVVDAEVFPIAREISDEIRQKVDEYLFRKEAKA